MRAAECCELPLQRYASACPCASAATIAGISLSTTSLSGATARTCVIATASRRGVAYGVATERRRQDAAPLSPAASVSANAAPSAFSALGGSSSVTSSTTSVAVAGDRARAASCARLRGPRRHAARSWRSASIGKPSASRDSTYACATSRDSARMRPMYAGALGDRDRAARVEQVERVRGLEDHLVAGQRQLRVEQALRLALEEREQLEQLRRVRLLEVVRRLLDLVLVVDVAVGQRRVPRRSSVARSRRGRTRSPCPAGTSRGARARR